jgi:two-component system, OmpR family, response regulator
MRILYIEDNPNDANLVDRYMRTTQHDLTVVPNLDDAWTALGEGYDLIMVDVILSGERAGFDFARQLRSQQYPYPLIAVTALSTPQDETLCYRAGFDYLLKKPFKITELAEIIDRYNG